MYVIVVGGGKVGYYLARSLLEDGHEVLIIEQDAQRCQALSSELGVNVLLGDGCEASTMQEAGMGRADVAVAVTGDDEDNLVVCQVAKQRFNVARTVARLNNPKNERIFRRLGIDATVSSTELILSQIERVIPAQPLIHLLSLRNVGVSFVEIEIGRGSPALGRPLRELGIPDDCIFPLIIRGGDHAIIPYGDTEIQVGDHVVAVTSEASADTIRRILRG
ncbi:MAG TPA: TrkA family potassium uptake protein [Chloroflexi bacterium]|nr:TrkA family potassium uptake protein [Chloroflexota bacterium]